MCEALILFISLFIHWSIAPGNNQVVSLWQSWGEHFSRSGLRLVPESNLFLEWESRFICRCRPLEVTLIHKCRHTWAHINTCAHTYIILATCYTYIICIFKWESLLQANNWYGLQLADFACHISLPLFLYLCSLFSYLICFSFICIDFVIIC